jgi:hypothetical protein
MKAARKGKRLDEFTELHRLNFFRTHIDAPSQRRRKSISKSSGKMVIDPLQTGHPIPSHSILVHEVVWKDPGWIGRPRGGPHLTPLHAAKEGINLFLGE